MVFAHSFSPEVHKALVSPHAIHASPTFMLCAPRTRGQFAARRQARVRRSDARRAVAVPSPDFGACLQSVTNAWCAVTRR
ncbi:MAG TPA: hypothetical protein VM029_08570 [Opitutaceae bacterium]|nr:hypothetical protein [Opitutaceae bacterium]